MYQPLKVMFCEVCGKPYVLSPYHPYCCRAHMREGIEQMRKRLRTLEREIHRYGKYHRDTGVISKIDEAREIRRRLKGLTWRNSFDERKEQRE